MSTATILIGAPDLVDEPQLVTALTAHRAVAGIRRCVDAVDLLGVASTGGATLALVSAGLPRAGVQLIEEMRVLGVPLLGLCADDDRDGAATLHRWGVDEIIVLDAGAVDDVIRRCMHSQPAPATRPAAAASMGRVVSVWGPYGAPGRTTVAVGIADELARSGATTMLVDCDPFGGAAGIHLGMLDESSGLVAACRRAEQGVLDLPGLARSARTVGKGLRVLTGLDTPSAWGHVRPTSLAKVLSLGRVAVQNTVVDAGFCLEESGGARGRSAVTAAAIDGSDAIVAVASADAVGVARLAAALPALREAAAMRPVLVVVNRMPSLGRACVADVSDALRRLCDVCDAVLLPYDGAAMTALGAGATLAEVAARSGLRTRLREVAQWVAQVRTDDGVPAAWAAA